MVRPDEGTEPGLVQGRELRREADQRIDEKYLLELLRPVAAGHQQMADLVLRIEQHDADRVEANRTRAGRRPCARSSCGKLSARNSDSSRACVRFKMASLLAASAVNSASRFLSCLVFAE